MTTKDVDALGHDELFCVVYTCDANAGCVHTASIAHWKRFFRTALFACVVFASLFAVFTREKDANTSAREINSLFVALAFAFCVFDL